MVIWLWAPQKNTVAIMSSDTPESKPAPPASHTLQGHELVTYIADIAADDVDDRSRLREERHNRNMQLFCAVILAIVVAAVPFIANRIETNIQMNVDKQILVAKENAAKQLIQAKADLLKQIAADEHELRAEVIPSEIASMGTKVNVDLKEDLEDHVKEEFHELSSSIEHYWQHQDLMTHLDIVEAHLEQVRLGGKPGDTQAADASWGQVQLLIIPLVSSKDISTRASVFRQTRRVLDLLIQLNDNKRLNEVEPLVRKAVEKDVAISTALAKHYGKILIASPFSPEESPAEMEALKFYTQSLRERGYPEIFLYWNLVLQYKLSGYQKSNHSDELVESIAHLTENDKLFFCRNVMIDLEPILNPPGFALAEQRIARILSTALKDYPTLLTIVETDAPRLETDFPEFNNPTALEALAKLRTKLGEIKEGKSVAPPAEPSTDSSASNQTSAKSLGANASGP